MTYDAPAQPRLSELLVGLHGVRVVGDADPAVAGLAYDSRCVEPGYAFVALVGAAADGHAFVEQALSRGAGALVVQQPPARPPAVPVVLVADTRATLAALAARLYGDPSHDVAVVGVTGTNGKTTVTYLVEAVVAAAGGRAALLGTTGLRFAGHVEPLPNTTPESLEVQRALRELADAGATHVALEASSHGLATHRLAHTRFAARAFLNLSRDHLDFHGDMERYFAAKRRLFVDFEGGPAVLNADSSHGGRLADELDAAVTFSVRPGSDADIRPLDSPRLAAVGIRARFATPAGTVDVRSPLVGAPNLENIAAALGIGLALGLPLAALERGLAAAPQVPGRLQRVADPGGGRTVLVDYAHTPDALARSLAVTRRLVPGRVGVVFGCGGDRDRGKRPQMGRAAADGADRVFVTSDNPRGEDPRAIIDGIVAGVAPADRHRLTLEADRRAALAAAIDWAGEGDALLVAGKGHESYQETAGVRRRFDDAAECTALLTGKETQ